MNKKNRDEFITYIQQHPFYPLFVQEIKAKRPIVPSHNPAADNTDEWKALSAQARGYDLVLSILNINME
jgi:hypothetical protein